MNFKFRLHHLLFFYTVLAGAFGAPANATGKPIHRTERAFMDDKKASNSEKAKALGAALAQIEKQFGKGSVMRLDGAVAEEVQVVSTGSLGLDVALGVGVVCRVDVWWKSMALNPRARPP